MVVTESRNMSLESLSRHYRRAAVQAPTGSASGKACGQAMAGLPAPRGRESGSNSSLLLLRQRSWPTFSITAQYPSRQQPNGVSEMYCLGYEFRSEGIRLADWRVIIEFIICSRSCCAVLWQKNSYLMQQALKNIMSVNQCCSFKLLCGALADETLSTVLSLFVLLVL